MPYRRVSDASAVSLLLAIVVALCAMALTGLAHGQDRPEKPVICAESTGVLAALCRMPVHRSDIDESPESRGERLVAIAGAIEGATSDPAERAWLTMTARRESGLASFVDLDGPRCSEGPHCDGGRAWSLWQLHGTTRHGTREDAARQAIETFRRAANHCRSRGFDHWTGGTSLFATGGSCEWPEAEERVAEMWRMFGEVQS